MAEELDVVARLKLFTGDASRRLARLSGSLKAISRGAQTAESSFARFAKRAVALGAAYLSIRAMAGAFRHLVGDAFKFEQSIQMTRLGLQTLVSNIEGVSFEQAGRGVDFVWERLRNIAIESVATTKEIHEVFAGIYGPLRAAGASMDQLFNATRNTVHAASALGVDMPQATRDIMLMAEGRAQAQVKLFTRLRQAGFLKNAKGGIISAEEWNKMAASSRVQKLVEVLGKFEMSGSAAARTLPGRISTFVDIVEQLRQALFAPIFTKFADKLGELNTWLLINFSRLRAYFSALGNRLRDAVGPAFNWIGSRLQAFGDDFEGKVDEWVGKFSTFIDVMKAITPLLTKAAAALAVVSASKAIVGTGIAVAGHATAGMSAYAAAGGGMAGLAAALGPLAAVMAAVASVAIFLVGVWYTVKANMESVRIVVAAYADTFSRLWPILQKVFGTVWGILTEIFSIFGTLLGFGLAQKAADFRGIVEAMAVFLDYVHLFLEAFRLMLSDLRKWLVDKLGNWVRQLFPSFGSAVSRTQVPRPKAAENIFSEAPGARPTVVNDFRGSTINIKQDFRQADPDRVAIQMIEDLARFAEQRVTSGFTPALTG